MRAKGQLNERQADLLTRIVSDEASVSSEDSTLALTVYVLRRRGRDSPRKLRIRDTVPQSHLAGGRRACRHRYEGAYPRPPPRPCLLAAAGGGHANISTTAVYLHTLPDADETALIALDKMRRRARRRLPHPPIL